MSHPVTGIRVKVHPASSQDRVVGFRGEVLHVRVKAAPERGKANRALVEVLAAALDLAKDRIKIVRGHTSRDKLVTVDDTSFDDLRRRLGGDAST